MLSGETAAGGAYPEVAVKTMAKICMEAESTIDYSVAYKMIIANAPVPMSPLEILASSAVHTANTSHASLILVLTRGGRSTKSLITESTEEALDSGIQHAKTKGLCKEGDAVVALHRIGTSSVIKVENQGVSNFDEIQANTNGFMIARGDLLPKTNSRQSQRCCKAKDCVSGEAAAAGGAYPEVAVKTMAKICMEAESTIDYSVAYKMIIENAPVPMSPLEILASSAVHAANTSHASLILVLTRGGSTAKLMAKYRPHDPILNPEAKLRVDCYCDAGFETDRDDTKSQT
nr:pyruvate kinase [Tanacetum cinerariifolium]